MRILLNPNKKAVKHIKRLLRENDGYCPSRANKCPETECLCEEFRKQFDDKIPGECRCGLYIIKN